LIPQLQIGTGLSKHQKPFRLVAAELRLGAIRLDPPGER